MTRCCSDGSYPFDVKVPGMSKQTPKKLIRRRVARNAAAFGTEQQITVVSRGDGTDIIDCQPIVGGVGSPSLRVKARDTCDTPSLDKSRCTNPQVAAGRHDDSVDGICRQAVTIAGHLLIAQPSQLADHRSRSIMYSTTFLRNLLSLDSGRSPKATLNSSSAATASSLAHCRAYSKLPRFSINR